MPVWMDKKFSSVTDALNWWSIFNGTPSTLALPRFVSDVTGTYAEISIQARNAPLNVGSIGFAVKADPAGKFAPSLVMDNAVNLSYPINTVASCFDPDTNLRGIYIRTASGWSKSQNTIQDKLWPDSNHPERLLELILCSWNRSNPINPGAGNNFGYEVVPQVPPPTLPQPANSNDWRNLRITFDMRVRNLYLGPWTKICQHIQGDIPRLSWTLPKSINFSLQPNANSSVVINGITFPFVSGTPTGNQVQIGGSVAATVTNLAAKLNASTDPGVSKATYLASGSTLNIATKPWQDSFINTPFAIELGVFAGPPAAVTNASITYPRGTPNFIYTKSLISDQLGFGTNSWGKKNKVSNIVDSGRRQVILDLTTSDADWECLGGTDPASPPTFYQYLVAPAGELLQRMVGNSYMMAVHPRPQSDANTFVPVAGGIPENERTSGMIMLYGVKLETP